MSYTFDPSIHPYVQFMAKQKGIHYVDGVRTEGTWDEDISIRVYGKSDVEHVRRLRMENGWRVTGFGNFPPSTPGSQNGFEELAFELQGYIESDRGRLADVGAGTKKKGSARGLHEGAN